MFFKVKDDKFVGNEDFFRFGDRQREGLEVFGDEGKEIRTVIKEVKYGRFNMS